uniref:Uncharacterized protein n=1 Tax=Emiliania huxleyi TaxID=2903 RepID=A0A7S3TRT3_EMIHU
MVRVTPAPRTSTQSLIGRRRVPALPWKTRFESLKSNSALPFSSDTTGSCDPFEPKSRASSRLERQLLAWSTHATHACTRAPTCKPFSLHFSIRSRFTSAQPSRKRSAISGLA